MTETYTYTIYSAPLGEPLPHDEEHKVELGLSLGELRQSLLDRFRQDIQKKNYQGFDQTLLLLGEKLSPHAKEEEALARVEDLLYSLPGAELSSREWTFSQETLYVESLLDQ